MLFIFDGNEGGGELGGRAAFPVPACSA